MRRCRRQPVIGEKEHRSRKEERKGQILSLFFFFYGWFGGVNSLILKRAPTSHSAASKTNWAPPRSPDWPTWSHTAWRTGSCALHPVFAILQFCFYFWFSVFIGHSFSGFKHCDTLWCEWLTLQGVKLTPTKCVSRVTHLVPLSHICLSQIYIDTDTYISKPLSEKHGHE